MQKEFNPMKKENRGGARPNSGRKKLADKKTQLSLYIRTSRVDLNGGPAEIRRQIYKLIDKKLK